MLTLCCLCSSPSILSNPDNSHLTPPNLCGLLWGLGEGGQTGSEEQGGEDLHAGLGVSRKTTPLQNTSYLPSQLSYVCRASALGWHTCLAEVRLRCLKNLAFYLAQLPTTSGAGVPGKTAPWRLRLSPGSSWCHLNDIAVQTWACRDLARLAQLSPRGRPTVATVC